MNLEVQFWTLLTMLFTGFCMGAAFDVYRVVSSRLQIGRLWIPVLDLLYWLAATIVVFHVLSNSNEGEVRLYVFIGLLIGIAFYFWLFSSSVIAFVVWLLNMISKFIWFLGRCFDVMVIKPVLLFYKLLRVLLGLLAAFAIFLGKVVLQLLRPFWLLLRWLLRPLYRFAAKLARPYWERMQIGSKFERFKGTLIALWKKWF
ncbi:spore cortex biosynthesis protein YabQ [Paenibacillaceae bacterium]|nr:spore cortex biosynthesis protein YabQ [Paenibacillaceae bacterium]